MGTSTFFRAQWGRVEGGNRSPVSLARTLLASSWLKPLNDAAAIERLAQVVDPTWSLSTVRARVVAARRETSRARTLVLRPNRLWPGHHAGQHVEVEAEVDGRRLVRVFSLSAAPRRDGTVEITVQRSAGGKVSTWWNERARVGDVLVLGRPRGDFVLPQTLPERLVFLSAGSGITPVMALLEELSMRRYAGRLSLVHCARDRSQLLFADALERLASRRPNFELRFRATATSGRLEEPELARLAFAARRGLAFVCGPSAFMDRVRSVWRAHGIADRLKTEAFVARRAYLDEAAREYEVRAAASDVRFTARSDRSLLEEAEAAGLRPAYGCRSGICHTCKRRKLSGAVRDLRDGRVSDEDGETVQLCIAAARSAVVLDL